MIALTRLNGQSFTLNAFLIAEIEALPDTIITLTNGKKLVVKEAEREVTQLILRFYQKIGIAGTVHGLTNGQSD